MHQTDDEKSVGVMSKPDTKLSPSASVTGLTGHLCHIEQHTSPHFSQSLSHILVTESKLSSFCLFLTWLFP